MTTLETAPPLAVDNLSKWYGPVIGLNQVTLTVESGVVGIVGPNGAGKSTLLKLITGQLRPSLGKIRVFGRSVRSLESRRLFGYSPDVDAFYEESTGRDFVRALLRLAGFPRSEADDRAEAALESVGMADAPNALRAGKRIKGCSKGMRQRIKLAQAIAHEPKLLVLDEPMTGLDPVGRREFSELIRRQAAAGATVLLSSHVLAELRAVADRVVLIAEGRLLADQRMGAMDRTIDDRPARVIVESPDATKLAAKLLGAGVTAVRLEDDVCTFETKRPRELCDALNRLVREEGCRIDRLDVPEQWAEALFDRAEGS